MEAIIKQGTIECECGNVYFFQSIRETIICMKCGEMNLNNGEPIPELEESKVEEVEETIEEDISEVQ